MAWSGTLLLAWSLQFAACRRPPDELLGEWVVDTEGLAAVPEIAALPPDQQRQAVALASRLMGDARVTLRGDGTVVRERAGERLRGRWQVVRRDEKTVVLQVTRDEHPPERWTLALRGPDRMTLTVPSGHALVLRRR